MKELIVLMIVSALFGLGLIGFIKEAQAEKIKAQAMLVRANAQASEAKMFYAVVGMAIVGGTVVGVIFALNKPQDREVVKHCHTERIERQVVVYLDQTSKREFYQALTEGSKIKYIKG